MITKEEVALWKGALRSGEYQQTRCSLKNGFGFCCLGVLLDVTEHDIAVHDEAYQLLRKNFFDTEVYRDFEELNDTYGLSFNQIADRIDVILEENGISP